MWRRARETTAALLCLARLAAPAAVPPEWAAAAGTGGCDSTNHSFDYLLLVEQWPLEFNEPDPNGYFTLHGLWPSRDGPNDATSYPCQCTQEPFDVSQLSSIMNDLNTYWPSYEGDNPSFWSHEWGKHGTCSGMEQLAFFTNTLSARKQYDAGAALSRAGISPGSSNPFTTINKAFQVAYGVVPLLGCDTSTNALKEVGWCLDKTGKMAQDCTASVMAVKGELGDCDPTKPVLLPKSGPPPPPPRPPPSPPGPPATQCAVDKHGPPCKTDADCASVPDCVRCAHSGYCTEVPGAATVQEFDFLV